jgi:hypothetical protein
MTTSRDKAGEVTTDMVEARLSTMKAVLEVRMEIVDIKRVEETDITRAPMSKRSRISINTKIRGTKGGKSRTSLYSSRVDLNL